MYIQLKHCAYITSYLGLGGFQEFSELREVVNWEFSVKVSTNLRAIKYTSWCISITLTVSMILIEYMSEGSIDKIHHLHQLIQGNNEVHDCQHL